MSFFTDFFNNAVLEESRKKIICNLVFGQSIKIIGNYKIETLSESEIVLKVNKERVKIEGTMLSVVSIAKGEIDVVGNVNGVMRL